MTEVRVALRNGRLQVENIPDGVRVAEVLGDGTKLGDAPVEKGRAQFRLPREVLNDGTVALVVQDAHDKRGLATYALRLGPAESEDPMVELAILRAELEALKTAFLAEAWHEKLRAVERDVIRAEIMDEVEELLRRRGVTAG